MMESLIPQKKNNLLSSYYSDILKRRSGDEIMVLANIKRFVDCCAGSGLLRKSLKENDLEVAQFVCRSHRIDLEVETLLPIWHDLFDVENRKSDRNDNKYQKMWCEWVSDTEKFREKYKEAGGECQNTKFRKWRGRQIERCKTELGDTKRITHSVAAIELSSGCSVGCWFCALDAKKFEGYFAYTPENSSMWAECLSVLTEELGPALQTAFCYWATEPSDNPDYVKYIKDFYDVVGLFAQTTTSQPLKNIEWTKEVLKLYNNENAMPCRFSLLNYNELLKVHEIFSPVDLLTVELIQQFKGSMTKKSRAGRLLMNGTRSGYQTLGSDDVGSTIACVSGYLVNMPERRVCLVTPCMADRQMPLGYKIIDECFFKDAGELRDFIRGSIDTYMQEYLSSDDYVRLRQDIEIRIIPDGIELVVTPSNVRIKCSERYGSMLKILSQDGVSVRVFMDKMLEAGKDYFEIMNDLQQFYDMGFLEDLSAVKVN